MGRVDDPRLHAVEAPILEALEEVTVLAVCVGEGVGHGSGRHAQLDRHAQVTDDDVVVVVAG